MNSTPKVPVNPDMAADLIRQSARVLAEAIKSAR